MELEASIHREHTRVVDWYGLAWFDTLAIRHDKVDPIAQGLQRFDHLLQQ